MRITEVQAVLFESLDPADDAVPDGGLDVIVALDRHGIPWRVLPHRSAVRTVQWATRGVGAPVRRCLVVACTDEGAQAAVKAGAIVAPVPPDGDIGAFVDRFEPGFPSAPQSEGVLGRLLRWFYGRGLRVTGSVVRQLEP